MEKTVESVKISDDFTPQLHDNQLSLLEARVKELEVRIESLEDDEELSDVWAAESEDKLELLEKRVAVLNVQNTELREHLNSVIAMVNKVTRILNNITTPHADEQPTVQQVYDMYQSQPATEEGWQEMTDAIKAAEEYEAQPAQQLFNTINGLTPDEWKDLLQIA